MPFLARLTGRPTAVSRGLLSRALFHALFHALPPIHFYILLSGLPAPNRRSPPPRVLCARSPRFPGQCLLPEGLQPLFPPRAPVAGPQASAVRGISPFAMFQRTTFHLACSFLTHPAAAQPLPQICAARFVLVTDWLWIGYELVLYSSPDFVSLPIPSLSLFDPSCSFSVPALSLLCPFSDPFPHSAFPRRPHPPFPPRPEQRTLPGAEQRQHVSACTLSLVPAALRRRQALPPVDLSQSSGRQHQAMPREYLAAGFRNRKSPKTGLSARPAGFPSSLLTAAKILYVVNSLFIMKFMQSSLPCAPLYLPPVYTSPVLTWSEKRTFVLNLSYYFFLVKPKKQNGGNRGHVCKARRRSRCRSKGVPAQREAVCRVCRVCRHISGNRTPR